MSNFTVGINTSRYNYLVNILFWISEDNGWEAGTLIPNAKSLTENLDLSAHRLYVFVVFYNQQEVCLEYNFVTKDYELFTRKEYEDFRYNMEDRPEPFAKGNCLNK